MKYTIAAVFALVIIMATSATAHNHKSGELEIMEQEETGLGAEMEALEEEMAEMMEELEDDMAHMQPKQKHKRGLTHRERRIREGAEWAKRIRKEFRDLETKNPGSPYVHHKIIYSKTYLPPSPACNSQYRQLTLRKLKNLVESMTTQYHKTSYAYIDTTRTETMCSGNFYTSGCDESCIKGRSDSEMKVIDRCSNARAYWSGWSPCVSCVINLAKFYDDQNLETGEFTIHIGKPYIDDKNNIESPKSKLQNSHYTKRYRDCLAYLISKGFNLQPWDWDEFGEVAGINDG